MRSDLILRKTIVRLDEDALLEGGRKVERGLRYENSHDSMLTDEERLSGLFMAREAAGRTFATWNDTKERLASMKERATPRGHDIDCPCTYCEEGWKRLITAVGIVPRGKRTMDAFGVYQVEVPEDSPVRVTRHRKDESDK